MDVAKPGDIQGLCAPNAILTFKEYLLDYAPAETRRAGEESLHHHMEEVPGGPLREETERLLQKIEEGERDLYF
jgi:2-iminoacetate synthase